MVHYRVLVSFLELPGDPIICAEAVLGVGVVNHFSLKDQQQINIFAFGPHLVAILSSQKKSTFLFSVPTWSHLVPTWSQLVPTWSPLGFIWSPLGPHLVSTWSPLGASWPVLGRLGASWVRLGGGLRVSSGRLGPSCRRLGPYWGLLETFVFPLTTKNQHFCFWSSVGFIWSPLGPIW